MGKKGRRVALKKTKPAIFSSGYPAEKELGEKSGPVGPIVASIGGGRCAPHLN